MNHQNGVSSPTNGRLRGIETLYKISNIINTTQDRDKVLRAILKEVVRITDATSGTICILDAQRGVLSIASAYNIPSKSWKNLKLELGVGVTGWVAYKGQPLLVNDVRKDPRYVSIKTDVRAEMAVPMKLQDQIVGVINVDSSDIDAFTEDDFQLLQSVAEQAARVFETARLYNASQNYAAAMERLFESSRNLAQPAPTTSILRLVTKEAKRLLGSRACAYFERLAGTGDVVIRAQHGGKHAWLRAPSLSLRDSMLGPAFEKGAPFAISNMHERAPFWRGLLLGSEEYRALLAVPVNYEGDSLGVIVVFDDHFREYDQAEINLIKLLSNQASTALINSSARDQIESMEENLHRTERFSLLGTLAAEIAHEIRNPITIVNLMLESIAEETRDNEQVASDLAIVREKIDRISTIVDQTLSLSREKELAHVEIDLNDLLEDVALFMDYKFAKNNVAVKQEAASDLPKVCVHRGQIQQVILNLVVNALEAMPDGGRLTLRTARRNDSVVGDSVIFSVKDSGVGIPKEIQPSLFEPFFTTRAEGTGLGLFISQRICTTHGGELQVASRPGRGSTFTVVLPTAGNAKGQTAEHRQPHDANSKIPQTQEHNK